MSLRLSDLLSFNDIVIQCHDNPDADALACGFVLSKYLKLKGKEARIIYSGRSQIQKCNLTKMIELLGIEIAYVETLEKPELLVTVDCQYGESNVTKFEAENIAVFDHHQVSTVLPEMSEVRSNYGSCATLIFKLLEEEGLEINNDTGIATALYYGLFTDTGSLAEISHPADRDLRDHAKYSKEDILIFRNSNLSREELEIAGNALKNAYYEEKFPYAIIEAEPCDPNILGVISDMLLEVEGLESCLVYSYLSFGVKISVRSCSKNVKASELAAYIAKGFGGGGGHLTKAGGFLQRDLFEQNGLEYKNEVIEDLMKERMFTYYRDSEIRYAGVEEENLEGYRRYIKREVLMGYVEGRKLAENGRRVVIRTLEGDVEVTVKDDLIIVFGIEGEMWPIERKKFEASYRESDEEYIYPGEYQPTVIDSETEEHINMLPYAKSCIALGGSGIYAKELDHRVKIFSTWDPEKYYLGVPGDYIAVRTDDLKDIYIIARSIFKRTYIEIVGE
ncbi:MAG: DHH family phosphoesterase [Lachnospiraceae bacterium]|nr:DHH family phosphoesterase [Lachnospiraceae bacterium]